jgi:hypothetical protein
MSNYFTEVYHNKDKKRFEIFFTLYNRSYRIAHSFEYFLISDMLLARENARLYAQELEDDFERLETSDEV